MWATRGSAALDLNVTPSGVAALSAASDRSVLENARPSFEIAWTNPRRENAAQERTRPAETNEWGQGTLFSLRDSGKLFALDREATHRGMMEPVRTRRASRQSANVSFLPQQGILEFVPQADVRSIEMEGGEERVVYCDYPVAAPTHRMVAGLIDFGMMGLSVALFVATLYGASWAMGESLSLSSLTRLQQMGLGLALVLLAVLYDAFFSITGCPTPGMQLMGLRLVTFHEGETPNVRQRIARVGGSLAIVCSGLIGLAWMWVDEECLTWADHLSHSFPTPIRAQYGIRR